MATQLLFTLRNILNQIICRARFFHLPKCIFPEGPALLAGRVVISKNCAMSFAMCVTHQ